MLDDGMVHSLQHTEESVQIYCSYAGHLYANEEIYF